MSKVGVTEVQRSYFALIIGEDDTKVEEHRG